MCESKMIGDNILFMCGWWAWGISVITKSDKALAGDDTLIDWGMD